MTTSCVFIYLFHEVSSIPGLPFIDKLLRTPLLNIEVPAAAIIAALSVHSEIGGT